jgi:hypothetical protein
MAYTRNSPQSTLIVNSHLINDIARNTKPAEAEFLSLKQYKTDGNVQSVEEAFKA